MKRKIAWIVMAAGLLLLISCKPEHTTGWITPTVSANTPTPIVVPTCTPKATPTPDAVAVSTEKPQPTVTTVPTENLLPSPTSTVTPLPTASPSPSPTPTEMPLARPTPTATPIPTVEPTPTATPIPTVEPSPTVMPIPTLEPSPTVMPIPTLEPSPTMTPVPTLEPSPTATPTPMLEPSPTATPTPTLEPSPTATPTPTAEPSPTSTPTPSPSPTPTVNPEPLINNGWQKNVSIDENYIIAFPELFRESVVEKEENVLSISYTCKEDADIEFQIRYCIQQTYEDVKNDILARNGMITEEYPELRRCSYALQENGKLYEGIMIESKYSYSLLGSAFGEEEWVNGVMQVVFSYPDNQTAKYDAEQYNYYVVENREE